jgi:hypothetical protein
MDTLTQFVGKELNNAQSISGQVAFEDLTNDPNALFNPKRAAVDLKHEKAEHRVVIMLKAKGMSNVEIARTLDFSPVTVNYIINQPWAQKRIVEEIQKAGRDEVDALLRSSVVDSIQKLLAIRDDPTARTSDVIDVCKYAVDRVLGKPKQAIDYSLQGKLTELTDDELAVIATRGTGTAPPAALAQSAAQQAPALAQQGVALPTQSGNGSH